MLQIIQTLVEVNSTRGLCTGGSRRPTASNVIELEYVTIATTSNTTDFGDLTEARIHGGTSVGNSTRGMAYGGGTSGLQQIQWIL